MPQKINKRRKRLKKPRQQPLHGQMPKLKVVFAFGSHPIPSVERSFASSGYPERISRLVRKHNPDFVAIEAAGSSHSQAEKIRRNFTDIDSLRCVGYSPVEVKHLVKTWPKKKRAYLVLESVPDKEAEKNMRLLHEHANANTDSLMAFANGDMQTAISLRRKSYELDARLQPLREDRIESRLRALLPELLEKYPHLRNRKEITILLSYGATHTPAYVKLKRHADRQARTAKAQGKEPGLEVVREHESWPHIYSIGQEHTRKAVLAARTGENAQFSNLQIARALGAELLAGTYLGNITRDKSEIYAVSRKFISKLDEARIGAFSRALSLVQNKKGPKELHNATARFFESIGMPLPKNHDEILRLARPKHRGRQ